MLRKSRFIILFGLILTFVVIWIAEIICGKLPYIDQWTRWIVTVVADTPIYDFFRFVTNFGSKSFLLPFTVVMALVIWGIYRNWQPAMFFAGGVLVAHVINVIMKVFIARERPSILPEANAEGYSFPSGHAMVTTVCYGLLTYFLKRKISSHTIAFVVQFAFGFLIFLIGISRFFINVHYLTDIITGFFIGYLCLIGFVYLYEYIQRKQSQS